MCGRPEDPHPSVQEEWSLGGDVLLFFLKTRGWRGKEKKRSGNECRFVSDATPSPSPMPPTRGGASAVRALPTGAASRRPPSDWPRLPWRPTCRSLTSHDPSTVDPDLPLVTRPCATPTFAASASTSTRRRRCPCERGRRRPSPSLRRSAYPRRGSHDRPRPWRRSWRRGPVRTAPPQRPSRRGRPAFPPECGIRTQIMYRERRSSGRCFPRRSFQSPTTSIPGGIPSAKTTTEPSTRRSLITRREPCGKRPCPRGCRCAIRSSTSRRRGTGSTTRRTSREV